MKLTTLLVASAFVALTAQSNAFSFDFSGVPAGTTLPPDLTINVAGYGDVKISPVGGSVLEVDTNFTSGGSPTKSLEFDSNDTIEVSFLGATVFDVDYDFIDLSTGEAIAVSGAPNTFQVTLLDIPSGNPTANGAGLVEVTFMVPEPASSMLGLLGTGLLFLRRRR